MSPRLATAHFHVPREDGAFERFAPGDVVPVEFHALIRNPRVYKDVVEVELEAVIAPEQPPAAPQAAPEQSGAQPERATDPEPAGDPEVNAPEGASDADEQAPAADEQAPAADAAPSEPAPAAAPAVTAQADVVDDLTAIDSIVELRAIAKEHGSPLQGSKEAIKAGIRKARAASATE